MIHEAPWQSSFDLHKPPTSFQSQFPTTLDQFQSDKLTIGIPFGRKLIHSIATYCCSISFKADRGIGSMRRVLEEVILDEIHLSFISCQSAVIKWARLDQMDNIQLKIGGADIKNEPITSFICSLKKRFNLRYPASNPNLAGSVTHGTCSH